MAIIPGQTGTPARAVDGLEGPTSGSPVTVPASNRGVLKVEAMSGESAIQLS